MGKLTYDSSQIVDFEDRLLAHLQLVIAAKLRRNESFMFSWKDATAIGDGRTAIWVHPAIPLVFKYHGGRAPVVSRAWVEALMASASSTGGLHIVDEPTVEVVS